MKYFCFIVPTLDAGGIENYLLRFLEYIKDKDNNITIICRRQKYGDLESKYEKLVDTIIHQPLGYININNIFIYKNIIKKGEFDTIVDFNGNFSGMVMLIAFILKVPKSITFYRRSSDAFKKNIFNNLYNWVLNMFVFRFSTKILSNSKSALDYFFKNKYIGNRKFKVIKNGVDPRIFNSSHNKIELKIKYGLPLDKKIVGHIGRYDNAKNHETIFKVAKKLVNDNFHFVFCGIGTNSVEFMSKLEEYSICNITTCLGKQDNVEEVLNTFDVFYFPSVTEGQPNALIEAVMCNIPILTSNINPIKEVIPKKFFDLMVGPHDVNDAYKKIKYSEYIVFKKDELRDFIDSFNSVSRFEEFKSEL